MTQDSPNRAQRRPRAVSSAKESEALPRQPLGRLAAPGEQIKGVYVRSSQSRVIHVDGAFGGPTNALLVHLAVFSEHRVPSEEVILTQQAGGKLLETSPTPTDGVSFVREVEADLMMSPAVARAIMVWLGDRLKEIDDAAEQIRLTKESG